LICCISIGLTTSAFSGDFPGKNSKYCGLPDDFALPKDGTKSAGVERFYGVYDGFWAGSLAHTLIVDEISDGKATGHYGHGVYERWGITKPGCRPFRGTITAEKLILDSKGAEITYYFYGDDLYGEFFSKRTGYTQKGKFRRLAAPTK